MPDQNQEQLSVETQVALLRQSIGILTKAVDEMRADMKSSYALFATKAEVAEAKAEFKQEVNDIKQTLSKFFWWSMGILAAIIVAFIIALIKIASPQI